MALISGQSQNQPTIRASQRFSLLGSSVEFPLQMEEQNGLSQHHASLPSKYSLPTSMDLQTRILKTSDKWFF
jgi:hypothetical protein